MMERTGRMFAAGDLWTLGLFSGLEPHAVSPLNVLDQQADGFGEPAAYERSVADMAAVGLLLPGGGAGPPTVAAEFLPTLQALQQPDEVLTVLLEAPTDVGMFHFLRRGAAWILHTIDRDLARHGVEYPFTADQVCEFLLAEARHRVPEPMPPEHERELELPAGELMVLLAMQTIFEARVSEGGPLAGPRAVVSDAELAEFFSELGPMQWAWVVEDPSLHDVAGDPASARQAASTLARKGLLEQDEGYRYTAWGRVLFDPGRLMDRAAIRAQRRVAGGWEERGGAAIFYPERVLVIRTAGSGFALDVTTPEGFIRWLSDGMLAARPSEPAVTMPEPPVEPPAPREAEPAPVRRFCRQCGEPLGATRFCTKCGTAAW